MDGAEYIKKNVAPEDRESAWRWMRKNGIVKSQALVNILVALKEKIHDARKKTDKAK